MPKFTDKIGTEWTVELDLPMIRAIKANEHFHDEEGNPLDLLIVTKDKKAGKAMFERLQTDLELMVDLLFVVCQEQAEKAKVPSEDFGRRQDLETIKNGVEAFMEAYIDFFPKDLRQKMRNALKIARETTEVTTGNLTPEEAEELRAYMRETEELTKLEAEIEKAETMNSLKTRKQELQARLATLGSGSTESTESSDTPSMNEDSPSDDSTPCTSEGENTTGSKPQDSAPLSPAA